MAKTKGPYGGRWKSGNTLDKGGQAQVYLVEDLTAEYKEPCALKRVINPERHERFRNEVEAIKSLSHPNVVRLLDHSALDAAAGDDPRQYLVMPVAKGGNLSKIVERYRGNLDDVLTVARQIALALQAAHAAGIIHRDIKPENILFPGDGHEIWVSDFGICLIQSREVRITRESEAVGPAVYMAPELEGGRKLDVTPDVDIYSLGKVIYYMITGGKRLPRERLHEEEYAAPFAAGGRLLELKILLSQMICERPQRIKSADDVISRLDATLAQGRQTAPQPNANFDKLKEQALSQGDRARKKQEEQDRADAHFNDVRQHVLAVLTDQLDKAAAQLNAAGLVRSDVQPFNPGRHSRMGLASKFQALDGREILHQLATPKARVTALQFEFYRKGLVRHAGQPITQPIGIWPLLQIREADGRPVKDCRTYLNRRPQGRGGFEYGVASEPAVFEFDISEWPKTQAELRQFIQGFLDAFPDLIRGDTQQFVRLRLASRGRR